MKRALPLVVLGLVVVAVVVVLVRSQGSGGGTATPVATAVLQPKLRVFAADGVEVPSGALIVSENQPFDLRMSVEANAFVYLFDETQNQLALAWKHPDPTPIEKGEYSADAPTFEGVGEHRLLLVAAPTPQPTVETWKVLSPDSLRSVCPQCEVGSYAFYVKGTPESTNPKP